MSFKEFDTVVMKADMPSHGLKGGDVGAVVQVYSADAIEVEFVTASGHTQALVTLSTGLVRPVGPKDIESFVFSELLKLSAWTEERVMLFHYRDRDQLEVDFILENSAGEIVGIEVKSAASVTRRDFLGLERVASAAGSAFKQGIVLYDGVQTLAFADNLRTVPLSALWA